MKNLPIYLLSNYRGFTSFALSEFHDSRVLCRLLNYPHPDFRAGLSSFVQILLPTCPFHVTSVVARNLHNFAGGQAVSHTQEYKSDSLKEIN